MFNIRLLEEMKDGSKDAFNSMFRYYYPRVIAYVSAIVDEDIAEDITQDVFLYVWENKSKLYIGTGFDSYLFQSAYTRCLDHFRKCQHIEKYKTHVENNYLDEFDKLLNKEPSVIKELYSKDFYTRLNDLLDQIPQQRREVFIMSYIDGLKAKDIAEQKQIPQRTIESHIYLTIKFLKEHLSKKDFYILFILILGNNCR